MTLVRMFDVRTRTRDGVELSADIWLPNAEHGHPLILLRTPYLKSSQPPPATMQYAQVAHFFAARGYAVAVQDVRGRGDSQGEYGYYFQEARDGYDTIEWMAMQPWCNGRVGMMGPSYLGAVQWLAASEKPPHLVCIAPTAAPGDFLNEVVYVGGAFLQKRLWWANYVSGRINQTNAREDEWGVIFQHRPLLTADEALGRKLPLYREMLEHATLDEYWKRLLLTEHHFLSLDLPALHVTGWFDSNQAGVMHYWRGMTDHSPAAQHQYLIIGPWEHAQTYFGGSLHVGEMEFTRDAIMDTCQIHLAFFDCYLKQTSERFDHPRARLYITGRNQWQAFGTYPVSGTTPRKLYLSSGGNANSAAGDGRLTTGRAADQFPDHYEFDPRHPVCVDPLKPGSVYGVDRREIESRRDVLVYTGDPLEAPVEVIGRVGVELYGASDARDTDFTASVLDVHPDGRAVVLGARVSGIIRARYRHGLDRTQLLTPGSIEKYHIDLGHIAHAFRARHRIRVEISSSAAPLYNPNQNTGNPIATDVEWRTAQQAIYHDERRPSALLLPVRDC
jgi:uncharacterized protein